MIAEGRKVRAVRIREAEFFGDSKRLRRTKARREILAGTIFCDLDGTLVKHEDRPRYDRPLELLPASRDKLNHWIDSGYRIVLMTARKWEEERPLRQALARADIPYHSLIMELPSGPRYLINDRKPSAILTPQVGAFEVARNEGIGRVQISPAYHPNIIRRFKGGSLAETLLLEDEEKLFIRKRISKRKNLVMGYAKLRNQFRTLQRFAHFKNGLVPAIYGDAENSFEYYYDMEYLADYRLLSQCSHEDQQAGLKSLLETLEETIYATRSQSCAGNVDWLKLHLEKKIYPKLELLREQPRFNRLLNDREIQVAGEPSPGLKESLRRILDSSKVGLLAPRIFCHVHGDLTFENVLFRAGDIKVIDMDSTDHYDAPELDMGKLFQSIVARYEEWANVRDPLIDIEEGHVTFLNPRPSVPESLRKACLAYWARILGCSEDEAYLKGVFYMGLHLIRMLPYRLRVSEQQALCASANAVRALARVVQLA